MSETLKQIYERVWCQRQDAGLPSETYEEFLERRIDENNRAMQAEIEQLKADRESTLGRLKLWGKPTNPADNDPVLVMSITEADNPHSNALICETLSEFYHQLEAIFFDGNDTRNFEDFWAEGTGVDIRFKRMSRKELDDLMNDDDADWEGF